MRILFLSTFYPPHVIGGWEQLVQEINQHLQVRGHETRVLTSTYGVEEPVRQEGVDRLLTLESDLDHYRPLSFPGYRRRLRSNLRYTEQMIDDFKPDVVFVHIMWNLSPAVAWLAEQLRPGRVLYYIADHWAYEMDPHTAYWRDPAGDPIRRWLKRAIAPIPLKIVARDKKRFQPEFPRVLCVSHAMKDKLLKNTQIDPDRVWVVYNGIDTARFAPRVGTPVENANKKGLSLLYAGSLVPHKGVHTIIRSLSILKRESELDGLSLTIVGSGRPDYEARLQEGVRDGELSNVVHFLGRVPRQEMPDILQKHDVLIFPSTWEEPLARMTQEAMAAGLVVVGTTTGGTGEILRHEATGLTFPPEDADSLTRQIIRLKYDLPLRKRLSDNARETVVEKFDIQRMIDEIEEHLSDLALNKTDANQTP